MHTAASAAAAGGMWVGGSPPGAGGGSGSGDMWGSHRAVADARKRRQSFESETQTQTRGGGDVVDIKVFIVAFQFEDKRTLFKADGRTFVWPGGFSVRPSQRPHAGGRTSLTPPLAAAAVDQRDAVHPDVDAARATRSSPPATTAA